MAKLKASCDQPLSDTLGISLDVRVPQLNCASGQPKIHEQQARWVQKNVHERNRTVARRAVENQLLRELLKPNPRNPAAGTCRVPKVIRWESCKLFSMHVLVVFFAKCEPNSYTGPIT